MPINEEEIRILTELGLTTSQAKIYCTLLKIDRSTSRAICQYSKMPRQEVYRVLRELQEKGYVEKIIATPYEFEALPISDVLSIILIDKVNTYMQAEKKIKVLFKIFGWNKKAVTRKQKRHFILLPGTKSLVKKIEYENDNAQKNVNLITSSSRLVQAIKCCFKNYEKALERGVKYRIIIEKTGSNEVTREIIQPLLVKSNFELRFIESRPEANVAIFDNNRGFITVYPTANLLDSPVLWTDHPSSIAVYQKYFESNWKSAFKYNRNMPRPSQRALQSRFCNGCAKC